MCNFYYLDYKSITTITLPHLGMVELMSHNYPVDSYADRKWIIKSRNTGSLMLTFLDFNVSVGSSLTIGTGSNFSDYSYHFKIGSPDIQILEYDTLIIKGSTIWIWFRTFDPTATESSTHIWIDSDDDILLLFDESVPPANGFHLSVKYIDQGCFSVNWLMGYSPPVRRSANPKVR